MIKKYFDSLKEDKYKRHVALVLFLFAVFLVLFTEPYFNTANIISRYLTIESIVEDGDFMVDERYTATSDRIYREGHYYSSKPPILSIVASSVYYVTYNFFDQDFPGFNEVSKLKYFYSLYPTIYITSLIFVGFTFWLMLLFFYKTLKLFNINKKYYVILILGLGLGTLFLPYSKTFNNHTIAGSLLFIAFYYLLLIKKENYKSIKLNKHLSLAGIFASLSAVIDLPTGLTFYALFLVYFLFKLGFRKIFYYIWPAMIIFSAHLYFNYQVFGGFLPAQAYKEHWIGPTGQPIINTHFNNQPWYIYIFNIFIGTHGFFIYTPLLGISLYSIYKIVKEKTEFISEALMVLFGFLIITLFYTMFARDYGGSAYGFRWFIAITPLIYFFIIFLFQHTLSRKLSFIFSIFFLWSALVAMIGVYDPWPPGSFIEVFGHLALMPSLIVVLDMLKDNIFF